MDLLKNPLINPSDSTNPRGEESRKIVRPSEVLIEWTAPERMFKTRSREFYRKIATIIIFFALLLFIIKEFLLIIVLGIVFFVVYVFHTVPPSMLRHRVTTNGVDYASAHLYKWEELQSFYIEKKETHKVAVINTINPFPGRIFLLLDKSVDVKKLSDILNQFISIVEKPEIGAMDKIMNFVYSRIKI